MDKAILIIDDKVTLCKSLVQNFHELGYIAFYAANERDAIDIFLKRPIHVVILDIRLGEEDGIDVLKHLLTLNGKVPIIMMTGYATIETAVESIKMGAFDFIQKPINFRKLLKVIENALKLSDLEEDNQQYKQRLIQFTSDKMVTQNKTTIELCQKAIRLASTDLPILLQGESGTGKELMADYIHANSPRSCYPMQKVNCASFPESLLDNELFGHEKGAFTGADLQFVGSLSEHIRVRYSLMKLVICLSLFKQRFCGLFKIKKSDVLEEKRRLKSTSVLLRLQTKTLTHWLLKIHSGTICITD